MKKIRKKSHNYLLISGVQSSSTLFQKQVVVALLLFIFFLTRMLANFSINFNNIYQKRNFKQKKEISYTFTEKEISYSYKLIVGVRNFYMR